MGAIDISALIALCYAPAVIFDYQQIASSSPVVFFIRTIGLVFLLNYLLKVYRYHYGVSSANKQQLPPMYPALIPWLGNAIPFLLSNASCFRNVAYRAGKLTSTRIIVAGREFFICADRQTVKKVWGTKSMSSPIPFYAHVLKHFFGMHSRALHTYQADTSGPFSQPFKGSNTPERNRLDHFTHEAFKKAFTGPSLATTTQRFMHNVKNRFNSVDISDDWTEMPDLVQFFRTAHGSALIEAVFGPALLEINPTFMDDLWNFDDGVPWLARLVPSFINGEPYRARKAVRDQLKKWYAFARANFTTDCIDGDGDGDPYWGSALIRELHSKYLQADNYDDDALASADLALAWGTIGNATPTTMLCAYHIFKDPALLERVRYSLGSQFGQTQLLDIDPSDLVKNSLMSSIQAEVLRLYVTVCVMVTSPHADVPLGNWVMPKGGTALVVSGLTHFDEDYWNTKNGLHPVRSFWADRFLTYHGDLQSGPVKLSARNENTSKPPQGSENPSFSTQGLEPSWIPYGGGNAICPGRLLAKRATFFTLVLMVREFDIEIRPHNLDMGDWKFGMGVEKPRNPIPFRIKRRAPVSLDESQ